jgi:hypothetical protein
LDPGDQRCRISLHVLVRRLCGLLRPGLACIPRRRVSLSIRHPL